MESISTDLAKHGAEKLIDKVITELRYVCCYTCIVEDFEKAKRRLEAERRSVEQRIQVAKGRGEDIQVNASYWEEQADELIKEDAKTKLTCFPNCIRRYRRGGELSSKTEEIKNLVNEGNKLENVGLPARLPGVERYSSQYYISFKSRESQYNELLDALKDDNNYIIGLQGMGGVGKTTLANHAGKELKKSKQFDHAIVTTVSSTPNIKKIQDDIAAPLGLKWEDCTESERPGKLWSRLTNGETILLILDDVWDWQHVNFEEIGIPSVDNLKGCKILVTTRNVHVCKKLGCERIIQLNVLSKDDAWIMFKRHANITDSSSSKTLLNTGREIAKECKGLPVAIAIIASSLKGQQRQEEWDAALKFLRNPSGSMLGIDENSVEIYKCFRFSYDYIKDEKSKGLFLLFSVFPEDKQVPNELFTRFGIGVGIFGEVGGKYDDTRSQVVLATNKLIDSFLLSKDHDGFLAMHDLVREAALWIANKEIQVVNISNKSQKSLVESENNIKYLSCKGKGIDVFSCRIDGSKLEILNIFIDYEYEEVFIQVPFSFFENMKRLRVLFIYGDNFFSLPQSIQLLKNIRSLFFSGLRLRDISILGNLQSLETLEFHDCWFDELPPGIAKVGKIRLLRLKSCHCNNPFEVIERCSSLEELYIGYIDFLYYSDILTVTVHHLRTPLQRYYIYDSSAYEDMDAFPSLSKLVSLSAKGHRVFSEETMKYFVQTAEDLRLEEKEWRNLIPEIVPIDEGMNDLVNLNLKYFPLLECLIDIASIDAHGQNVLSKLVELTLEGMDKLKELCNGPFPSDFLKSLERLEMDKCDNLQCTLLKGKLNLCYLKTLKLRSCTTLESLFHLPTARSLLLIEELRIYYCDQLKNIISSERKKEERGGEIVDCGNVHKSHDSLFPNLKILIIIGCPQLQVILPFISAREVPLLENIHVSECHELKYIFSQYQHGHEGRDLHQDVKDVILGSLKEMTIGDVPNFIDIFFPPFDHAAYSSLKRPSSKNGSQTQIHSDSIKWNIFLLNFGAPHVLKPHWDLRIN